MLLTIVRHTRHGKSIIVCTCHCYHSPYLLLSCTLVSSLSATFAEHFLEDTFSLYNAHTRGKTHILYEGVGSTSGREGLLSGLYSLAGSDFSFKEITGSDHPNVLELPSVSSGIAPVFNLPHVASSNLTLSMTVVADIFMGSITHWNDSSIISLNPLLYLDGLLPHEPILVAVRGGSSGTTGAFTRVLAASSTTFNSTIGSGGYFVICSTYI